MLLADRSSSARHCLLECRMVRAETCGMPGVGVLEFSCIAQNDYVNLRLHYCGLSLRFVAHRTQ